MSKKTKEDATTLTFAEQHDVFKNNVYPGMIEDLAEKLGPGVTTEAIETLGVGYYPGEYAWIFAERDAKGDIIGLQRQYHNGKKFMMPGSKRGLIYPFNQGHEVGNKKYDAGKCQWVRIADVGVTCPICAKPDWCRVSPDYEHHDGPSAAACSRIKEGSVREIPPDSHLHIIDPKRQELLMGTGRSVLPDTELPILVVEGPSDVLAAISLGFVAIGRPSALGGMAIIKEMPIVSKEIWVIGENDMKRGPTGVPFYPGKEGMQKTFINIRETVENVKCVMPPKEIKDLRQWVQGGLTQGELYAYIGEHDDSETINSDMLPDDVGVNIAGAFMNESYMLNGVPLLKKHQDQMIEWDGGEYVDMKKDILRGNILKFLDGKKFQKKTTKGTEVVFYKPTRAKLNDILDGLNKWCPIDKDPPVWLDDEEHPDPNDLIVFKDGILDINEYMKGNEILQPTTPLLFTKNALSYNFDPSARSDLFEKTYKEWFSGDEERIRLLFQWMGLNLLPDMSQEKLMIFKGPPRSGKGTMLSVLQNILGKNNNCVTSFQSLASTHGGSLFQNKLAAIIPDDSKTKITDVNAAIQKILTITGGDTATLNPKYIAEFNTNLVCRFSLALNHFPKFEDPSGAFESRVCFLEFPNSYLGKEDRSLKNRLAKEAREGKLINYALRGLKDLREQGELFTPESSLPVFEELRETTVPSSTFFNECTFIDEDKWVLRSTMYDAWVIWCDRNHHREPGSEISFGRLIRETFKSTEGFNADFRATLGDGSRPWAYKGLDLQPWVYERYLQKPKNQGKG